MQHIRAITLDLDDTLWEITPVIRRAEAELWHWLATHYPDIPDYFTEDALLALRQRVMDEHTHRRHDLRFLRKKVLGHMAEAAGYTTELVEPAFQVFDAARNKVEFYADVLPALRALAKKFPIIAVTNGNANLESIGIRNLFSDVVTAVDAGAAKPARAIFERAVKRAGVAAAEILHVGDHPEIDVVGAGDAGLTTAWMNRRGDGWPRHLRPPDAIVTTLQELQELLAPAFTRDTAPRGL
ncbi:MAG: HAD family hydrolase [Woeseia sp.]